MPDITLTPITSPFHATITPPGSKSLTNRALVLASMATGQTTLSNVLFADDTEVMLESLTRLGYELNINRDTNSVSIHSHVPPSDIPAPTADLFCGNSGTTLRFLAAAVSRAAGTYRLDGIPRMRQRPLGALGTLLKNLGVRVSYELTDGYPPITIHADRLPGGILSFGNAVSSQFLSAILMVAPFARHEVRIDLLGQQPSWPYVAMTMRLMDQFHHLAELIRDPDSGEPKKIIIPQGHYRGITYQVEPDASNASYFLAAAALHPGSSVTIQSLGKSSLQGDIAIAEHLKQMGAELHWNNHQITITGTQTLHGIEVDLTPTPDLAQTLAVTAAFASTPTTLHGLHTLRVKETDRIAALQAELAKLGSQTEVTGPANDTLTIHPRSSLRPATAEIETYDDHRMAMSFALAGTKTSGITIKDAQCCSKTYPNFFDDFRKLVEN